MPTTPLMDPDPVSRVFSIDHARREKDAFFARESDAEHERRRYHPDRLLASLDWSVVGVAVFVGVWNLCAVIGIAWLVGRLIASIEAGVWL